MENRIYALSDSFPSPDDLKKKKNWFGVGDSWLKYLLLTPPMLLTIPFVFCLFYKIIIICIPKGVTEPPTKMMMTRLEAVDQMYSCIYAQ